MQTVEFTNIKAGATTSHQITATKNLTGGTLAGGDFTFILSESGHELQRKTNSADGSITFDPIVYDEDDIGQTFTYKIEEVNDGTSGVRYDESVYYVEVQVTQDTNGHPVATQTRVFKTPGND